MLCFSKTIRGYRFGNLIGRGSYGEVFEIQNHESKFALKRIKLINQDDRIKIYREIKILKYLSDSKYSAKLFDGWIENDTVFLVMQLYDMDLSQVKSSMITELHLKYIAHQLFTALSEIHKSGIIHRDIKPQNVLINAATSSLALCDYNMSTIFENEDTSKSKSLEVASKWYQAPELLCENSNYGCAIDIWAAGCVLAELVLQAPIWNNDTKKDRFGKILRTLGDYSPEPMLFPFSGMNTEFKDFLIYIFCVDSLKRPTADEVLAHAFLSNLNIEQSQKKNERLYFEDSSDLNKIQEELDTIKKE